MTFDETNLVPNAGLLPAAVLAQRLDLAGLVNSGLRARWPWVNAISTALGRINAIPLRC